MCVCEICSCYSGHVLRGFFDLNQVDLLLSRNTMVLKSTSTMSLGVVA